MLEVAGSAELSCSADFSGRLDKSERLAWPSRESTGQPVRKYRRLAYDESAPPATSFSSKTTTLPCLAWLFTARAAPSGHHRLRRKKEVDFGV